MSGGRRREETSNFMSQMRFEFWSGILKWLKLKKCIHKAFIYNLNVTKLEENLNFYSNFTWIWIWICGAKILLIMISEFQLWFNPLIQDQIQDFSLSVLRCHEACKAWRTCTKCDYMIWQWGVASKCSPPPYDGLKFNWIGLLPIQLNFSPNTHTK